MSHADLTSALWDLSRATGLTATVVLAGSIVLGIVARSGRSVPGLGRLGASQLHRTLALTGVGLIVLHVVSLLFDPYAELRLLDPVVPFVGDYRPFWLGLGTLTLDVTCVVVVVALLRHRLGPRAFRLTHGAVYALFPLAIAHGLGTGTDAAAWWSRGIVAGSVIAVVMAVLWRSSDHFTERGIKRAPRQIPAQLIRSPR